MKLLTFGNTTINIDRAIRIDDSGSYLSIDFVPTDNPMLPMNVRLDGRDAAALRSWLAANSENLSEGESDSIGAPLDDPRPYTSPR